MFRSFFLLPFALLAVWAYTEDSGAQGPLRGLRAALFAFLVVEAFYWGISLGGIAAAAGAIAVYSRLIRPRPGVPLPSPGEGRSGYPDRRAEP